MRHRNIVWLATGAALAMLWCAMGATEEGATTKEDLAKAIAALKTYDWGEDRAAVAPIDEAVSAARDAAACRALESPLLEILAGNASRDAKQYICRKLMIIGSAASAPVLGAMLPDKDLSHMARYALERISAPEAAQAMRDALPKVEGVLKIGVISSLGAHRDATSIPSLAALLGDGDKTIAAAAACALGDIGTPEAAKALGEFAKKTPADMKLTLAEASLICAARLLGDGKNDDAMAVYDSLGRPYEPKALRLAAIIGTGRVLAASPDKAGLFVQLIEQLVPDGDKERRAVGLQLLREAAKGSAATKQFAGLLASLPPALQVELLDALADRADRAARPAVLDLLKTAKDQVRVAALRALGTLGEAADVPLLLRAMTTASDSEQAAARDGLTRLSGPAINGAIVAELKSANPETRVELIGVLVGRRALGAIPALLGAAEDPDANVRMKAMNGLGQLARPEDVPAMLKAVLKTPKGSERDAADTAVMLVCNQTKNADERAQPLLSAMKKLSDDEQTALLPTLGKVGGSAALKIIEAAMSDKRPERRDAGFRALYNWPDGSISVKLLELAQQAGDGEQRLAAVRALIRVAPLPDKRPDEERLDMLKKAMSLTTCDEDRNLVLKRAAAIRSIETLRFAAAYMYHPTYAQQACATVVELAHHRELRDPNKAEFDKALDAVISISKDPPLIDEAKRYKKGQT